MMNEDKKLVSKELLKEFGAKSKRIFRSTLSDKTGYNYKITSESGIPSNKNQKLKYVIKGSTEFKIIDCVVILNYTSETSQFVIQALDYGTSTLTDCSFVIDEKGNLIFNFTVESTPIYLEAELIDLNRENVNIAKIEENDTVIIDPAATVIFEHSYSISDTSFKLTNAQGIQVPYSKDIIYSNILESKVAGQLKNQKVFSIDGAVSGQISSDLSGNINFNVTAGKVSDNSTIYSGVRIDNETGAVEGCNIKSDGIITGYPVEDQIYRPLYVDNNNRGYVTLPNIGVVESLTNEEIDNILND